MIVQIPELRRRFVDALTRRGLSDDEARIVAEPFVEAELAGKRTHGIMKFVLLDDAIRNREGKPEIVRDAFNYALIDAHRELGYLSAPFAASVLIEKARAFGNAIVATKNSYYFSLAGIYARQVAEAGFLAIIANNGGPAAVAPFGGVDAIFGTNPIAIGIPYKGGAIVLDMATSKRTWGEINLAKIERRDLDEDCFFDAAGLPTVDPTKAAAIKPFGEAKGSGLNAMLEILTGAFVGAKMGLQSSNGYDLGFLFLAYSPEMFGTKGAFEAQVEQLLVEIKRSRPESGVAEVFLPGERSARAIASATKTGFVEIAESVWSGLVAFSEGTDVRTAEKLVE